MAEPTAKPDQHLEPMNLSEVHQTLLRMLAVVTELLDHHGLDYCLFGGGCLGIARHDHGFVPWDDDLDLAVWARDWPRLPKVFAHLPTPYATLLKGTSYFPTFNVFDSSTQVSGATNAESAGVFIDIVPMMVWPGKLAKVIDRVLEVLARTDVSTSPVAWKRLVSRIICSLPLARVAQCVQRHIFFPYILTSDRRLFTQKQGLVTGALGRPWHGKYPFDVIFPTQLSHIHQVPVKIPRHLDQFLKNRYGTKYLEIPDDAKRWRHFQQAYRIVNP
ncbi:LicD family protein [Synechococcus sp. PCC 6312]|uniref:LicD family protein n=1 Tax=Synechococcus sp. (strain ATCC 27167 / PCC 6312) TaxID=195253 RepID=UPI00029F000C|nr:LicD family protein [Synechococcus sp. PCC 6312]AFY62600.1 LPS biosynthesis protein [Synechococcus sp. PCC 6312]